MRWAGQTRLGVAYTRSVDLVDMLGVARRGGRSCSCMEVEWIGGLSGREQVVCELHVAQCFSFRGPAAMHLVA